MTFESFTQSLWVETFARSLAHSLWQGAVLAAVLALVLRFVSNHRSRLRYGLALLSLAGFVLLPTLNIAVMSASSLDTVAVTEQLARVHKESGAQFNPFMSLAVNLGIPWEALGAALYALGVVLLAGRLMVQFLYLRRLRQTATPVDETLRAHLRRLTGPTGTARAPQLAFSNRIDTAMVMGWRAPLILLPANVRGQLTPKQLDGVLLHELAHVKTHDYAVNFLQLLAETLLYYHPALWWVSGVVRQEREYRCDDLAARVCGDHRDYAEALLALEKARARPTSAMALAGTSGDFAARIQRLFGRPVPRSNAFRLALRLGFALTLGVGAGFAQPRKPAADQTEPSKMAERPLGEPTPAECATLKGKWFHIKIAGLMVEAEPPTIDPGIAVPSETPDVKFHVETPSAEFRGRCMIEQPSE